jgi:hypothetical protein
MAMSKTQTFSIFLTIPCEGTDEGTDDDGTDGWKGRLAKDDKTSDIIEVD